MKHDVFHHITGASEKRSNQSPYHFLDCSKPIFICDPKRKPGKDMWKLVTNFDVRENTTLCSILGAQNSLGEVFRDPSVHPRAIYWNATRYSLIYPSEQPETKRYFTSSDSHTMPSFEFLVNVEFSIGS
ncbi:hypothetical protein PHET_01371 [Paragonimus heterotremus]|uniref:Uncharacterized protein n=1 Tax=Paragonimus heterotremus TaxID=100268 RepID=A0A8J4TMY0_9TREM|nr:hypothetical protein PHET_01371 [Paragonimus heterotremus]